MQEDEKQNVIAIAREYARFTEANILLEGEDIYKRPYYLYETLKKINNFRDRTFLGYLTKELMSNEELTNLELKCMTALQQIEDKILSGKIKIE